MPALLAAFLLSSSLPFAQEAREEVPDIDPYTKGEPAALEAAGYVSLGPFRFGKDHTTEQVVETLGGVPVVWAETAHFKIGLSLESADFPTDKDERKKLEAELKRLKKKLPKLRRKKRDPLDPWLRLHLYAQRLEELHADFLERTGTKADDFHVAPRTDASSLVPKFRVLLTSKESSLTRYVQTYMNAVPSGSFRHYAPGEGGYFFGSASGSLEGDYATDLAFHCSLAAGVSSNMVEAYGVPEQRAPYFLSEGIAHWYSREVDPRFHFFSQTTLQLTGSKEEEVWRPRVRARVHHGVFPSTAEMLDWNDPSALSFADHMILWSRLDYLFLEQEGKVGELLGAFESLAAQGAPVDQVPPEGRRTAFQMAMGVEPAEFDAAWAAWVEDEYPKK